MSEYRTLIDRVAERATPPHDAFERLTGRREKRHRNRRIGTALLAIVVAAVGLSGLLLAIGHTTRPPLLVTPPTVAAVAPLWPQYSTDQAGYAQERADAGDPAFTWLLDPAQVATRFAEQFLGWKDASAESIAAGISSRVSIPLCESPSPCSRYTLPGGLLPATVTLSRLGKTGVGGVWSVTGVRDPTISIWGPGGQRLREAALLGADDPLAAVAGGEAGVGAAALTDGPCGFLLRTRQVTLVQSPAYFDAGADLGTCPAAQDAASTLGYVLAFTPGKARPGEGHQAEPLRLTATAVAFVPSTRPRPLPTPTDYAIRLPAVPTGVDEAGLTIFDAPTNLPEGTWVVAEVSDATSGSSSIVQVQGGHIRLRVADTCRKVGTLAGSRFTLTVRLQFAVAAGLICGINMPLCGREPPQAPRAIAILGRNFEYVRGPLTANGTSLAVSRIYELSAETCTATGHELIINPQSG